jgi:hypothetical protein
VALWAGIAVGYGAFQLGGQFRIRAKRKAEALIGRETVHNQAGDHFAFVDAAM